MASSIVLGLLITNELFQLINILKLRNLIVDHVFLESLEHWWERRQLLLLSFLHLLNILERLQVFGDLGRKRSGYLLGALIVLLHAPDIIRHHLGAEVGEQFFFLWYLFWIELGAECERPFDIINLVSHPVGSLEDNRPIVIDFYQISAVFGDESGKLDSAILYLAVFGNVSVLGQNLGTK